MNAPEPESPTRVRERLEQQADATRERLISDIDELTDRTQRAEAMMDTVVNHVKRHKTTLIVAGVGIAVLSLVAFVKLRASAKRRERHRVLGHLAMQLMGVSPPPPPQPGLIRRSLTTLGGTVATAALKHAQQRILEGMGSVETQHAKHPAS